MKSFVKLLIFVLIFKCAASEIVEIEDGLIEGTTMQSRKGVNFHAFLKIPFAKPPIGDLRFEPPVRNDRYNGTHNATAYGPMCMQWGNYLPMSEDCLHLYVYTKDLTPPILKPVIIFIHGGAFELGSGVEQQPQYLMDRDVVVVFVNYRLGALGFLAVTSALTGRGIGNMGLKDQALAIQWVNRNIEKFGGDPNSVTLAGLSAGSLSVTAHMASDMTKGLFHRVIGMSGAITWHNELSSTNIDGANQLAERLNCPTTYDQFIDCLKGKDAFEIQVAAKNDFYDCPSVLFIPVLEPDFGQERFFTRQPNEIFKSGNFSRVPILIGITADEYLRPVSSMIGNSTTFTAINENFVDFTSKCFSYDGNGIQTKQQIGESIRKLYFPLEKIDMRSFTGLGNLCSDAIIGYGVHRLVHYISNFTDVFYYKFTYIGRYSMFNFPSAHPYGAHHADDVQYVMQSFFIGPEISQTDPENFMVERMTRIWEQFAERGDPNNSTDVLLSDMNWPKHDIENEYYLDIGLHMIEKQGLFLERFAVWDSFENEISASSVIQVTFFAIFIAFMSHLTL